MTNTPERKKGLGAPEHYKQALEQWLFLCGRGVEQSGSLCSFRGKPHCDWVSARNTESSGS
jgi:hypothetical protein